MDALTIEEFQLALPDRMKKTVNAELVKHISATLADPDMYEAYRENLISYASVMADGRFKMENYISAVKYCSHKMMDKTNIASFSATFPQKVKDWAMRGVDSKDVASYVSSYAKSKLVIGILTQSMIPSSILNQDLYQKALNVQDVLMRTAFSEKVRSDAANSLLTHLKPAETAKVELNIGMKPDSSIAALRESALAFVAVQKAAIQDGKVNAQEVAHSSLLLEGEKVDD
jgi:hypothetical protein